MDGFDPQLWTRIGAMNRGTVPGSADFQTASSRIRPEWGPARGEVSDLKFDFADRRELGFQRPSTLNGRKGEWS
jgi:hypothetical protein